jgi:DNA-binding FrmR family transcriptional regulator
MQLEERAEIVRQLHESEGHVRVVAAMIENGQPCVLVLHQLDAIRATLSEISAWLVTCQVEQSREVFLHGPRPEDRQAELTRLADLYGILTQFSIPYGVVPNE